MSWDGIAKSLGLVCDKSYSGHNWNLWKEKMSTARSSHLPIRAIAALSAFTKYALARISCEYFFVRVCFLKAPTDNLKVPLNSQLLKSVIYAERC